MSMNILVHRVGAVPSYEYCFVLFYLHPGMFANMLVIILYTVHVLFIQNEKKKYCLCVCPYKLESEVERMWFAVCVCLASYSAHLCGCMGLVWD